MRDVDATIGQWVRYDDSAGIVCGEPYLEGVRSGDTLVSYVAVCSVFWPATGKTTEVWCSDLVPIKWHKAQQLVKQGIKLQQDSPGFPATRGVAPDPRATAKCPLCKQYVTVLAGLYANHGQTFGSPVRCVNSGEPIE